MIPDWLIWTTIGAILCAAGIVTYFTKPEGGDGCP